MIVALLIWCKVEISCAYSSLSSDGSELSTSQPSGPSKASRPPVATHPDVPVVPFGTDLVHWGEDVETPMIARSVEGLMIYQGSCSFTILTKKILFKFDKCNDYC